MADYRLFVEAQMDAIANISFWTGLIGGLAGLVALIDRWRDRRPHLHLFAPYYFSCFPSSTPLSGTSICNIFVRISNTSKCAAYLYLETLSVDLKKDGIFHKTKRLDVEFGANVATDFSQPEKIRLGIGRVPWLSRFDDTTITREKPLSGYVAVTTNDDAVVRDPEGIRLCIRDCQMKEHVMEVDLRKQMCFDPSKGLG